MQPPRLLQFPTARVGNPASPSAGAQNLFPKQVPVSQTGAHTDRPDPGISPILAQAAHNKPQANLRHTNAPGEKSCTPAHGLSMGRQTFRSTAPHGSCQPASACPPGHSAEEPNRSPEHVVGHPTVLRNMALGYPMKAWGLQSVRKRTLSAWAVSGLSPAGHYPPLPGPAWLAVTGRLPSPDGCSHRTAAVTRLLGLATQHLRMLGLKPAPAGVQLSFGSPRSVPPWHTPPPEATHRCPFRIDRRLCQEPIPKNTDSRSPRTNHSGRRRKRRCTSNFADTSRAEDESEAQKARDVRTAKK